MVRAACNCGGCGTGRAVEVGRCGDCGREFCEACLVRLGGGEQACRGCLGRRADDERAVAADLAAVAEMHAAFGIHSLADVVASNAGLLIGA
jgi:hypothetical protein